MKTPQHRELEKKVQEQQSEIKLLDGLLRDVTFEQKKLLKRALKAEKQREYYKGKFQALKKVK